VSFCELPKNAIVIRFRSVNEKSLESEGERKGSIELKEFF